MSLVWKVLGKGFVLILQAAFPCPDCLIYVPKLYCGHIWVNTFHLTIQMLNLKPTTFLIEYIGVWDSWQELHSD
jgi:hypothetical protein